MSLTLIIQEVCLKHAVWAVVMKQPITRVPSVPLWRERGESLIWCHLMIWTVFLNNMNICNKRYWSNSFEHRITSGENVSLIQSDITKLNKIWWHNETKNLWLQWSATFKATYLTFKMNVFNHLNDLQTTVSLCLELKEDGVKIESIFQSIKLYEL